jgi:hypothetical protein
MQRLHEFITWHLCVAQHVSGASTPIIRSLNCISSLWFNRWRVVVAALLVVVWPAGQTTTNNVKLTLHPPSSAVGHERVQLYLYSPYGLYDLYTASMPVQGCTLPFSYVSHQDLKVTVISAIATPPVRASAMCLCWLWVTRTLCLRDIRGLSFSTSGGL